MVNHVIDLLNWRFATKAFDTSKKVEENQLKEVLEAGRLSPSSFGLEPWKFVVVESQDFKDRLQEVCFNQTQVGEASQVIIILGKKWAFNENSSYVKELFDARMPKEVSEQLQGIVGQFLSYKTEEQKISWMKAQGYLAAQSMMMSLAELQIDSCPMEGFLEDKVLDVLELNPEEYCVSLVLPIGYRKEEPRDKTRLSFEEVVEFK